MFLWAQILRIIGSVFSLIADKSNNIKKIFLYNSIGNLFCGIQYFFLNAITGSISSILAIIRNIYFFKSKEKINFFILLIYFFILVLLNINSISGIISIIPILLVIIYTSALYTKKTLTIKWAVIITCILEIMYDYIYKAYVGIFICIIDIVLVIQSIFRIRNKN